MGRTSHFQAMGFKVIIIILLGLAVTVCCNNGGSFSTQKILEVERKIKHLRRHSLKIIQSEDGDIIDCIDIKKQLAFDHPALKDHKIQMAPTYNSAKEDMEEDSARSNTKSGGNMMNSQAWQKNGTCPKGTIPVRRIRKRELLKSHSIEEFGRKKPNFSRRKVGQLNRNLDSYVARQNHSKAILFTEGYRFLGGKGDIKVCWPTVEKDDEYSTSQVSLLNGEAYNDYELVEAGWMVNPGVYGDRSTRLFVYWTADGSRKTGCFDLTCPGFIQTSNEIALGAAISPISLPGDLGYTITISIYKDPNTNNWWMQFGEKKIGYWPAELFESICYNAASVEWGGEVYSTSIGKTPHTETDMGCGRFATDTLEAASVTRIRIHDNSPMWKFPEWVYEYSDEYRCYDVWYIGDYVEDPLFYFGGPGRNAMCP